MKTEDLISVLVADLPNRAESVSAATMKWLPASLVIVAMCFYGSAGVRPGMSSLWPVVVPKLMVTLALACAAMMIALRLTRPEATAGRFAFALAIPAVVLALLLALEFRSLGTSDLSARMMGRNGTSCLLMIPLLSLAPLAAFLHAARCGAVTHHTLAGSMAGAASAGLGASLYALHCTDDSLLFVALWYSLATLLMACAGALAFRLVVRW